MPIPAPNSGEAEGDFMARCMSNETMRQEYPEQDQRAAVCNSQWKKRDDKMAKKLQMPADLKTAGFVSKIESVNEKDRTLVVKISTDQKDRDGDVLLPRGADLADYLKNPVVLWAHRYDEPPIAKALWTKTTDTEVLSKPRFAETDFAEEIYQLYVQEFLTMWSVGFMPGQNEDGSWAMRRPTELDLKARPDWKDANIIEKWGLWEYSAVPVPSNPGALTLAVKEKKIKKPEWFELVPDEPEPEPVIEKTVIQRIPPPNVVRCEIIRVRGVDPEIVRRRIREEEIAKRRGRMTI